MSKWAGAVLRNRLEGGKKKAGEQGLEPRLMDPETIVLPLHHSPVQVNYITQCQAICQGGLQNKSGGTTAFIAIQTARSLANPA